ncbi:hypothetical protein [Streptomyces longisporus]|uniref:Uncharacterized protein n=1 Tax=Streptomyces longisporus TaxID=1948 RepID=A0ABP5Y394_STRLO
MSGRGLVAALLADAGDEGWLARVPGRLAVLDGGRRLIALALEASWMLEGTVHAEVGER